MTHRGPMPNMDDHRKAPRWRGPVERHDPATVRQRSRVLIVMCANRFCRRWFAGDRCPQCGERREDAG